MTKTEEIDKVLEDFCMVCSVTREQLLGRCRSEEVVAVRALVVRKLRDLGLTYHEIGRIMHRDHSSVIHYFRRYKAPLIYDYLEQKTYRLMEKRYATR